MATIKFAVDGKPVTLKADPNIPLRYALRGDLGMKNGWTCVLHRLDHLSHGNILMRVHSAIGRGTRAFMMGCLAAFGGVAASAADLDQIKLGMTPKSFVESAQIVAQSAGFFERNGLKVELVELRGDVLILQALISGDIQIGSIGSYAIFNAIQKGARVRAFLATVPEQPHMLVASRDVKSWADLVGKNFAISEPGAISQTFPRVILSRLGVDPDKVNWVAVGGNAPRQRALTTGTVQATLLHMERALQVVRSDNRFHTLGTTAEHLPGVPLVMNTAQTKWLEANKAVATRYTKAIIEATRFIMENKPAMLKLGKDLIGDDPGSVEAAYDAYRKSGVWGVDGGLDRKGFDFTIKLGIETGEMRRPISYDDVVDARFVAAVLTEIGPFRK